MKKDVSLIFFILLLLMLAVGCTGSNNGHQENVSANTQSSVQNTYQDADWVRNRNLYTEIMDRDSSNISTAFSNSDYYTTLAAIDIYKQDIDSAIKSGGSIQVSPELQSCKDEYRLALIDDYNAITLMKQGISLLTSGDYKSSDSTLILVHRFHNISID